ncbi:MBL fold metallo-hydrolase [Chloroflexota bacterium]|nr:MBL fold metallo-hydrolase [Chloroflexota bacterium]
MFDLTMLPARQGDAIWINWGDANNPHTMIVDMGTEEIGKKILKRLKALPEDQRTIDLLVVTHVDSDHIGGVLTCLADADPLPGLKINDVWFNGYQHLSGGSIQQPDDDQDNTLEAMGPVQGERLSSWLRKQHWNKAFNGAPVQRIPGETLQAVTLPNNLKITVLGPTPESLHDFINTWAVEVEEALKKGTLTEVSPGLEPLGGKTKPVLDDLIDLELLADTNSAPDNSEANGSSITLLLEYDDKKVLLAGDAFPGELLEGIKGVSADQPLKLDAFKLPHHCSMRNNTKALIEAVDCDSWLISSDGTRHRHPDAAAIARVIVHSKARKPNLLFNVPSKYNGWWDDEDWRTRFGYLTQYGTKKEGLTLHL